MPRILAATHVRHKGFTFVAIPSSAFTDALVDAIKCRHLRYLSYALDGDIIRGYVYFKVKKSIKQVNALLTSAEIMPSVECIGPVIASLASLDDCFCYGSPPLARLSTRTTCTCNLKVN